MITANQSLKRDASWLPITGILILSIGLCFYQIGSESLWVDELYSVNDALLVNLTPKSLVAHLSQIRPLYYILLKIWIVIGGESDSWLRILSVPFSLGSVFLTYRLGRKISGEYIGLLASLMLAIAPMFIYFAQMVRMYSLGIFLGLCGSLALAYAIEEPKQKFLGFWAITRVLTFLTAPLNITLLLPDIVLFGFTYWKQPLKLVGFGKWLLFIFVACAASAYTLIAGTLPFLKSVLDVSEKVGVSATSAESGSRLPSIKEFILKFKRLTAFPFPSTSKIMSLFFQTFNLILLSLVGISFYKNSAAKRFFLPLAWTFLPWIFIGLVSKRLLFDRYIVFTAPYLIILLAAGLIRVWQMHRGVATLLIVIYAIANLLGLGRYYTVQDRQDWRGLAQVVSQYEQPSDVIVLTTGTEKLKTALTHYYKGNASIERIPGLCDSSANQDDASFVSLLQLMTVHTHSWLVCGSEFNKDDFQRKLDGTLKLGLHQQFVNEMFYRQEDYMYLLQLTTHN